MDPVLKLADTLHELGTTTTRKDGDVNAVDGLFAIAAAINRLADAVNNLDPYRRPS